MIFQEKKSANAGPSCGTGEGVAHSKRWYVALVRMHHEKKVSERLSKWELILLFPFSNRFINGATVVSWWIPSCFR